MKTSTATADAPVDQPIPTASVGRFALVYDSETSGLPLWKEPTEDPRQPHIVELAAKRVNLDTREVVETMSVIIKPDGWELSQEVINIHGITMERAMDEGIPEKDAVEMLLAMWAGVELIGHNESFDRRMVRIGIKRFLDPAIAEGSPLPSAAWKEATAFCTCWKSRPILKLAGNKLPKLTEAYQHFLGVPMQGAHTAMGDVDGCLAVYWAIQDLSPMAKGLDAPYPLGLGANAKLSGIRVFTKGTISSRAR